MSNTHYLQKRSHLDLLRADLWRIESGVVRATTWLGDGATTLGFWGAGDVVGNGLLRRENYQLECLTPVRAAPLLAQDCPDLVLLAHIHQLQELLMIRSCKRIEEMLLELLTWLGQKFGNAEATGLILKTFFTHQELAETLNTTRVTITRSMSQLERQGTIRYLANRRLFIDRSICSFDPVSPQLSEHLATSIGQSSIVPTVGVVSSRSNRALTNSRR